MDHLEKTLELHKMEFNKENQGSKGSTSIVDLLLMLGTSTIIGPCRQGNIPGLF